MNNALNRVGQDERQHVPTKLLLIWQSPASQRFVHVGDLESVDDGAYTFRYQPNARDEEGFLPLSEFPDFEGDYLCWELPAFFSNRVMNPRRESYGQYLSWLGLSDVATPMEILARTGGGRQTVTFHVVDSFQPDENGVCSGRFFVSGMRYKFEQAQLETLYEGQLLSMLPEPDNPKNPNARLLTAEGDQIGYVPDWLLGSIEHMESGGMDITISIDQVNSTSYPHLWVMAKMVATP